MPGIVRRTILWLLCAALVLFPCLSPQAETLEREEFEMICETTLILTGTDFHDDDYLIQNTAMAASYFRRCEASRTLIYRFDLSDLAEAAVYVHVWQNYLVEASSNGEHFVTVANYISDHDGVAFDGTTPNHTLVRIGPEHVDFTAPVYVRIRSADASKGYGGTVGGILLRGKRPDTSRPAVKVYGDTNGDGKADASDALQCLQHSVRLISLTGVAARAADVNGNGAIDASDALLVLQKSVSLIEQFPAQASLAERILKDDGRLLFLGDSITDALRDRENPDDLGGGFVARIQCMLASLYPQRTFHFINRGYSGWTTGQLSDAMKENCIDQKPDVVTVMIGINDVVSNQVNHHFIPPEVYEYHLTCILEAIRSTGAVPIVFSPYAVPSNYTSGWHEEELDDKIAVAQRVAAAAGAIYIPIDRIFNEDWVDENYQNGLSSDGVHPFESGMNVLAAEWIKAVEAAQ